MQVTKFVDAMPYEAPNHHNMVGLRLQGFEVSESKNFWVGLSQFLPGGGAGMESSELEKVYVVLRGEVVITTDDSEVMLGPKDSCLIPPNESRAIQNKGNETAEMLVIMNYPEL